MFGQETQQEKAPADWSGTIIALALSPVFFLFVYLGKAEIGFNVTLIVGLAVLAVKLRWEMRWHVWFWATVVFIVLLHIPLLFLVHWPHSNVPTIAYSLPLGIVDFLFISGALGLAERLFLKGPPE